jgi:hypothetical protein
MLYRYEFTSTVDDLLGPEAAERSARQDVMLEFADDAANLGISGVGQFRRVWDEPTGITDTDKGIVFSFTDGTKN